MVKNKESILNINSVKGIALPEVMVSLAIVLGSLVVSVNKYSDTNEMQRRQKALSAFSQLTASLSASAVSLPTLFKSAVAGSSSKLKNCLNIGGSEDCISKSTTEFKLYDITEQISGTKSAPLYIKLNGDKCDPKGLTASCAFSVTSKFTPFCGKPGNCDVAQAILVSVEIVPVKQVNSKPAFWDEYEFTPKPITLNRELPISLREFLAYSSQIKGGLCEVDADLQKSLVDRQSRIQNAFASGQAKGPNVVRPAAWSGKQYHKYLRGISWNGELICEASNVTINAESIGPRGDTGPRGPQGPPGICPEPDDT